MSVMKKFSEHEGFTLVELLIVIVVIGVLAAMMMMSSTEAVTTAKATKIINDLKLMKTAINAWYLDNYERLHIVGTDGYHVDAVRQKNGTYKGGTRLHDYLNKNSHEIGKYFSNSAVSFNSSKANWEHASRDQYGASTGNYGVYFGYGNTVCYVLYKVSDHNNNDNSALKAKLKARAKSAGLLTYDYKAGSVKHKVYDGVAANVFMESFRLDK